ncbi:MAG: nickel ABC transporter permease [Methylophilaceae bacterium]|jgi:peptide/nickel transport system permease protein
MIKRFLGIIPVVFGVVSLTFLLIHAVPGDPVEVMLGESASNADRMELRAGLGLDKPIYAQFGIYLSKLVQGDFGISIHSRKPIVDMLLERLPATFKLAAFALLFAIFIGLPLGIIAAINAKKWPDTIANLLSLTISAMPHFWMGPMLMMVFALWLGILPVSGMENATSIILPALTLGFGLAAILTRMTRASMLEVLHEDYIRTAYAKGLPQRTVILRHALRAALLPVITVLGLQLGSLLAGAVITETVFSWNGIGRLLVESIEKRDYLVTQACVLVVALVYVIVNFVTDVIYTQIDPRVRFLK